MLSLEDQATIAKWIIKTAMVLQFHHHDSGFFFQEADRAAFFNSFTFPGRSYIVLSRWNARHVEFKTCTYNIHGRTPDGLCDYRAYVTTLAIGRVIMQWFSVKNNSHPPLCEIALPYVAMPEQWRDFDIRIWPRTAPQQFPPRLSVEEQKFELFSRRWADFRWIWPP
ncbi:MAG: hypothetical protein U0R19_05425 [Bryobacteraceae bacterium]